MILGFKEFFDTKKQKQTDFREKIICPYIGLPLTDKGYQVFRSNMDKLDEVFFNPKLHTIREDKHDRWKAGRSIQMVYRGAGYKIKSHFNKDIPQLAKCVSVQIIEIQYLTEKEQEEMRGMTYYDPMIKIDGKPLFNTTTLAENDGFTDDPVSKKMEFASGKFLKWFNKDFKGKIIHWTDLRY